MAQVKLTRPQRILVGVVLAGAVVIAAIGFAGSYTAVKELAEDKGFGDFAPFFPIGVDAGIVVLLALDLLLTWLRIPFPLLRQTAWLLTAATIAFNGASAWGDPLGVAMHAIIPILFVITVEAARHAIGRVADITADRYMEGVRAWRWILAPIPTLRLWRRMKLWELRSYQAVIDLERDRLIYQAHLRTRYGRAWRRRAPVQERMPLRLARYGIPITPPAEGGNREERDRAEVATAPPTGPRPDAPSREQLPPPAPPGSRVATAPEPGLAAPPPPAVPDEQEMEHKPFRRLGALPEGDRADGGGNSASAGGNGDMLHDGHELDYRPEGGKDPGNDVLVPVGASSAEQPRGRRLDVRIPAQWGAGDDEEDLRGDGFDGGEEEPQGPEEEAQEPQEEPPPDYTDWDGRDAVKDAYGRLSDEERKASIRKLAPVLAERTGLSAGTVRVYLGELRKAEKVATTEQVATSQ